MKPVYQTEFAKGNCLSACLASLLEVECADIPSPYDFPDCPWFSGLNEFLIKNYNTCAVMFYERGPRFHLPDGVPFIACGRTNIKTFHAVVMQISEGRLEMIHDPGHGCGLESYEYFLFLLRLS